MICHKCNEKNYTDSISRFVKIGNLFSGHITKFGRPSMKNRERKLLLRAGTLLSERGWATQRWRLHVLCFGGCYWKLVAVENSFWIWLSKCYLSYFSVPFASHWGVIKLVYFTLIDFLLSFVPDRIWPLLMQCSISFYFFKALWAFYITI